MDCLRSFSVVISSNSDETSLAEITTWGVAPQNYWLYQSTNSPSTFNIQGYKNINVFKIEAIGNVNSNLGLSTVLVQDWEFHVTVNGQNPTIGGTVNAINGFVMSVQNNNAEYVLSKFNPSITFKTPIQSASALIVTQLQAQGIGAKNLASLNINWNVTFNVYYKFEGE